MHLTNFIFTRTFYPIASLPNIKKLCDSNKSRIIFSGKRIFTTLPLRIFVNKFFNGWNHLKSIFQNKILINKLLNFKIIYSFYKFGNGQVVENLFPEKKIRDLLESHRFFKIWYEVIRKKVQVKIKFVKCIIFLCFKFFSWKLISFLSHHPFNNKIAILESKIIYFCLRSNFCGLTIWN